MAEDSRDGGDDGEVVVAGGEVLGDLHGSIGFTEVEQEGRDGEAFGSDK